MAWSVRPYRDSTRASDPASGAWTFVIGLALAAGLTAAAFGAVHAKAIWGPGIPLAIAVLAVALVVAGSLWIMAHLDLDQT